MSKSNKIHLALTIFTFGGWAPIWFIVAMIEKERILKSARKRNSTLSNLEFMRSEKVPELQHHKNLEDSISEILSSKTIGSILIEISKVRLYEARQGDTITRTEGYIDAETRTGTVGLGTKLGPIDVGVAASKGRTQGNISSTSVTKTQEDKYLKIDEGKLSISDNGLLFLGEKFTRQLEFSSIISASSQRNELIVAAKGYDKNTLLAVNTDSVASLLASAVQLFLTSTPGKPSKDQIFEKLESIYQQSKRASEPIESEIRDLEIEISQFS